MSGRAIEAAVAGYYARAFAEHGAAHRGVDWSSAESQDLRFRTLVDGFDWSGVPSLLDYGCGYGALAAYLDRIGVNCRYVGFDLVPAMIEVARQANRGRLDRTFTTSPAAVAPADYVVASGIFNVKLDTPVADWTTYVEETVSALGSLARRRLAFNMLPAVSAPDLARGHLHYADPQEVARRCEVGLGGVASIRCGYGLWEFTVVVSFEDGGRR